METPASVQAILEENHDQQRGAVRHLSELALLGMSQGARGRRFVRDMFVPGDSIQDAEGIRIRFENANLI